jgi:hypothetical protein
MEKCFHHEVAKGTKVHEGKRRTAKENTIYKFCFTTDFTDYRD